MVTFAVKLDTMKYIMIALVVLMLAGCGGDKSEEKRSEEENSVVSYDDMATYFSEEYDEDVDDIEYDDETGYYNIYTTSGNTYRVTNWGGGIHHIRLLRQYLPSL